MAFAEHYAGIEPLAASDAAPVRALSVADLKASLREGWADFSAHRGDILFIGIIYPLIGILTAFAVTNPAALPAVFPLLAGVTLLGPLVSTGFYELARRQEAGLESNWRHFLDVVRRPAFPSIMFVGAVLIGLFSAWVFSAIVIYGAFMGPEQPASIGAFLSRLFGTPEGWGVILVGNLVGFGFAALVLAISVVSLPMLVDDHVDAGQAIRTSIAATRRNPAVIGRWGLTVAVLLFVASIPAFLGLAVVLPWLGYSTWHLYTRAVDRRALDTDG
jgi:uncharacterized membrane protein